LSSLFVTFDGPNGSGKSTLLNAVGQNLQNLGFDIYQTKEPTSRFHVNNEEKFNSNNLFDLLLEDRLIHLRDDISPALSDGKVVLCDRYIASSLVYQRIDGLTLDFIWSKNSHFLVPDLSILVYASEHTLQKRLTSRNNLTRFEKSENRKDELSFYLEAVDFLQSNGYFHIFAENEDGKLQHLVDQVVNTLHQIKIAK
jgi:dTMP kinase